MKTTYRLGTLAGLRLTASWTAIISSLILWSLLTEAATLWLHAAFWVALAAGLVTVLLYWASVLVHQLGHAWAARRTGHPMTAIHLWLVLSTSRYPRDEPELPAGVHIRRALGGPVFSLVLALVLGVLTWILRPVGGIIWWATLFLFLDNLLVLTLGALLPLGFTDGSTLLHWARKHQRQTKAA
ncbi:MAG TPA: hypothetical protein VH540_13110 [Ktedonobacterales bacterium]|jgi:hypothetical protein